MKPNIFKLFWRWAVMFAGVAACVALTVFAILFFFKNQIMLGPTDSGPSSGGANWLSGAYGASTVSIDSSHPATKGSYDLVMSNSVADKESHSDWRSPPFSLGPANDGARPITFSFAYKLPDTVAKGDDIHVNLRFFDSTGANFISQKVILVGALSGDSEMTGYRTIAVTGIKAPQRARTADVWINANSFDPWWVSGTAQFADISVTTTAHSLLLRSCASTGALIGAYALIVLLVLFWRWSVPAISSGPMASSDPSQASTQTLNAGAIKSFWRGTVMIAGVAACAVLAGFAIRLLLQNHVMLGPPDSNASTAGANWMPDRKGEGSVSVDFKDPATKGGYDFVLNNTVAGPTNNAECRCPLFPLGPAAEGESPITFSFAYKLPNVVTNNNKIHVQLRFFGSDYDSFISERVIPVGTRTGDSDMTGYRTATVTGIKAPRKAQMADVWVNANIFAPWVSGPAQFANISVTTVPHSLLFRVGVIATALVGICALIVLLVRFWRWNAPALPSSPIASPALSQPPITNMNTNTRKSIWLWAVSGGVAVCLLVLGLAIINKSVRPNLGKAAVYKRLGDVEQTKGNWGGAIADYTKAIKLNSNNEDACRNRGDAEQGKHDWDSAIADYTKAIKLKPADENAYRNRGDARQNKHDWEGAIADYTKAIELRPDDENAYRNRGDAEQNISAWEGAIADYTKAIELKPADVGAYRNRGDAEQGKHDWESAIADYTKAVKRKPDDGYNYLRRSDAEQGKNDWDSAIADCTKAIELRPDDAYCYLRRGDAKQGKHDWDGALADYDKAIGLAPNDGYKYLRRGDAEQGKHDWDGAIADYNKDIELKPDDEWAIHRRGDAKREKHDWDGAIADYSKAIKLAPNDEGAYHRRGDARQGQSDWEGAIADYDKAIELSPNDEGAYHRRGDARQGQNDWEGAIADYNKAIELAPDDAGAYHRRGDAKQGKRDLEGAIADYTKAIELSPDDEGAYYRRGDAKQGKGDLEGAIADYTKAIELNPDDADVYFHRSLAKKAKGDLEGASADHSKAIKLKPDLENH